MMRSPRSKGLLLLPLAALVLVGVAVLSTRCGPIDVQQAGADVALRVAHGRGGGHDQGLALAGRLAGHVTRVIAMSRFGHGTHASAQHTAAQIAGARLPGFNEGGHHWAGHDDEVRVAIVRLLSAPGGR